jgi:hypothetical protein
MYNVGQADNLLSAGRVQYPSYSIQNKDYPCIYTPPNNAERPKSIPLGQFQSYDMKNYTEPYVEDTQQKKAGEMGDSTILIIMIILFAVLCLCAYISFQETE